MARISKNNYSWLLNKGLKCAGPLILGFIQPNTDWKYSVCRTWNPHIWRANFSYRWALQGQLKHFSMYGYGYPGGPRANTLAYMEGQLYVTKPALIWKLWGIYQATNQDAHTGIVLNPCSFAITSTSCGSLLPLILGPSLHLSDPEHFWDFPTIMCFFLCLIPIAGVTPCQSCLVKDGLESLARQSKNQKVSLLLGFTWTT